MTRDGGGKRGAAGDAWDPGWWASCASALIRPRVGAGLIEPKAPPGSSGVSGYTGGGKAMIAEYEGGAVQGAFLYGAGQGQKHLPEITLHRARAAVTVFVPSGGHYAQGVALGVN